MPWPGIWSSIEEGWRGRGISLAAFLQFLTSKAAVIDVFHILLDLGRIAVSVMALTFCHGFLVRKLAVAVLAGPPGGVWVKAHRVYRLERLRRHGPRPYGSPGFCDAIHVPARRPFHFGPGTRKVGRRLTFAFAQVTDSSSGGRQVAGRWDRSVLRLCVGQRSARRIIGKLSQAYRLDSDVIVRANA